MPPYLADLPHVVAQRVGLALVHFIWQGTLLAFVLAGTLYTLRDRAQGPADDNDRKFKIRSNTLAHVRYMISCLGMLALSMLPIVNVLVIDPPRGGSITATAGEELVFEESHALGDLPQPTVKLSVPPSERLQDKQTAPATRSRAHLETPTATASFSDVWRTSSLSRFNVQSFFWAWLAGVGLLSVWHYVGWATAQRMRRRATVVGDEILRIAQRVKKGLGIRFDVEIRQTVGSTTPVVVGWLKPAVLLPSSILSGLTSTELEALLAHELAHIRRHDYLVNLLQSVVETILFYHPAIWWLSRRIRNEREFCADDLAVHVCQRREAYVRCLVTVAEIARGQRSLAIAATGGSLLSRVRRIMEVSDPPRRHAHRAGRPALAGVLVAVCLTVTVTAMAQSETKTKTRHDNRGRAESTNAGAEAAIDPSKKLPARDRVRDKLWPLDAQSVTTETSWPMFRGDLQNRGVAQQALPKSLGVKWRIQLEEGVEATPAIAYGKVFIADTSGGVYALRLEDGQRQWAFQADGGLVASPSIRTESVYIGDRSGRFYCLDAATGHPRWTFHAGAEIRSSANFLDGDVLFGCHDGSLYCLDAADGNQRWVYEIGDEVHSTPTVTRGHTLSAGLGVSVASMGRRVVVAACDGRLHVVHAASGEMATTADIDAPTQATAAVVDSLAFVGTENGQFHCIDVQSGETAWIHQGRAAIRSSAAVNDRAVFVGNRGRHLLALDRETGQRRWQVQLRGQADSSPVLVGDLVVVGSSDGRISAFRQTDGAKAWDFEAGGQIGGSVAVGQGTLVFANSNGDVIALAGRDPDSSASTREQPRAADSGKSGKPNELRRLLQERAKLNREYRQLQLQLEQQLEEKSEQLRRLESELKAAQAAQHGPDAWADYSQEGLEKLLTEGRPVVVWVCADWCTTCKVVEQQVLQSAAVRKLMVERGYARLRLDVTSGNVDALKDLDDTKEVPQLILLGARKRIALRGTIDEDDVLAGLRLVGN